MPTIGVLALQGAFARHIDAIARCGADAMEVRTPEQLEAVDALIIPGGESTAMSKLLVANKMLEPLAARLANRMPVFGTCAGMILLADKVLDGRPDQHSFGAIDIDVRRNAYGRQLDSFEADLEIDDLIGPDFRAVFIRAPGVERVGPDVEVLAEVDDRPVLCRSGSILVSAFHPELSGDDRVHQLFLASCGWSPAPAIKAEPADRG